MHKAGWLASLMMFPLIAVAGAHLDPDFGSGGIFEMAWPTGSARAAAMGVDPAGRIVVGGTANDANGHSAFAFFRLLPDGTLDRGWAMDAGGVRLVDFDLDPNGYDRLADLQLEPDGSAIAAGAAHWGPAGIHSQFALTRLDAKGRLDTSFGTGGLVHFQAGSPPFQDSAWALAIDGERRIVVLGQAAREQPGSRDVDDWLALARLTPQGALDFAFAGGGLYETRFQQGAVASNRPRGNTYDIPGAIALDARGHLIVGGSISYGARDAMLYRTLPDGTPDEQFGNAARVRFGLRFANAAALLPLPDGRLMVAGSRWTRDGAAELLLSRRLDDGSGDPAFGEDGITTAVPPLGIAGTSLIARGANGGWLLVGGIATGLADGPTGLGAFVARFDASGRPDETFGRGGFVLLDLDDGRHFSGGAAVMQVDGEVLVAGCIESGSFEPTRFAVMRIVIDGDAVFANGFDG